MRTAHTKIKIVMVVLVFVLLMVPLCSAGEVTIKETAVPTTPTAKPTILITTIPTVKPTLEPISENLVSWKSITPTGESKTPVTTTTVKTLLVPTTMLFDAGAVEKTLQVYPQSKVTISKNYESVMQQSSVKDIPPVELYYGYQKSAFQPWQYYYRVDNCGESVCRVVRAEFETRKVWLEDTPVGEIGKLSTEGIPPYLNIPKGIEVIGVTAL